MSRHLRPNCSSIAGYKRLINFGIYGALVTDLLYSANFAIDVPAAIQPARTIGKIMEAEAKKTASIAATKSPLLAPRLSG
jgi:hypothetical protein